ncbi:MAG: pyrimidine-nucleoside phosphorylase [Clostridiales bacterium]
MRMYDIIVDKRNGKELTQEQIAWAVAGYTGGSIPDYQVAAWLMAIYFQGMTERETAWLTDAMAASGELIDLAAIPGIKVDKHSTGGVGDKTTLIVGPIVAACGVPVAKMSGRGLGHTGGTVDKLEAIPGFQTVLPKEEFCRIVREVGIAVIGQSGNIAPADKKLYALRDVTGTVENISLIASSIMSKKIAAGADAIVLDVKTGRGAFMETLEGSLSLAKAMVAIGEKVGRKTIALVTDMDEPLGAAVGNALEVEEAAATLRGRGPEDLQQVCLELAANMLLLAGKGGGHIDGCREIARQALADGRAFAKLKQMVAAQGGDPAYLEEPGGFPAAPLILPVKAQTSGYVTAIDALAIGNASAVLGAGRLCKEDDIDHRAGLILKKKIGQWVEEGQVLAELHTAAADKGEEGSRLVARAIAIGPSKPQLPLLIHSRVTAAGVLGVK